MDSKLAKQASRNPFALKIIVSVTSIALAIGYYVMKGFSSEQMLMKKSDPTLKDCPALDKAIFKFETETAITSTPEVEVSDFIKDTLESMIALYECKPVPQSFDIYDPIAEFEDPICYAQGVEEIKVQFYGMPKVFPRCKIVRSHVFSLQEAAYPYPEQCALNQEPLKSTLSPYATPSEGLLGLFRKTSKNEVKPKRTSVQLKMELWQLYATASGAEIPMKSIVTLDLDPVSGKIIRHQDFWNYKASWRKRGGFIGAIWNFLRRGNGKYLGYVVSIPE